VIGPRLVGRVALITGAARGQGRTHAETIAAHGADLILIDVCADPAGVDLPYPPATEADLEETAALARAQGRRVVTHVVDVRDAAALDAAVADGVRQLGHLDIVCPARSTPR
jgi:NAD(P)-dependent dehydrogenase (short-subunit alcohol dehydrogenase family)